MLQKSLLGLTVLLVLAFVFTFPTRDRRRTIDSIRMKVGAENAVSQTTRKEWAQARIEARKRQRQPQRQNRAPAQAQAQVRNVKSKVR